MLTKITLIGRMGELELVIELSVFYKKASETMKVQPIKISHNLIYYKHLSHINGKCLFSHQ